MTVVLFVGGVNLVGMGVLGEYVWRALDEIRGRSLFLIEAELGGLPATAPVPGTSDRKDGMLGLAREASRAESSQPERPVERGTGDEQGRLALIVFRENEQAATNLMLRRNTSKRRPLRVRSIACV